MQNFTTIWQRTRNRLETIVGTIVGTMLELLLMFLLWNFYSEYRAARERAHRISTLTGGWDTGCVHTYHEGRQT